MFTFFCLLFSVFFQILAQHEQREWWWCLFLWSYFVSKERRLWRYSQELKRNCNYMHFWELDSLSLSPFEFIVLRKKVKNDLTKVWKWGTFFYYYLLSISLNIFQICELFLTHLSLWSGKPRFNVHSNDRCAE